MKKKSCFFRKFSRYTKSSWTHLWKHRVVRSCFARTTALLTVDLTTKRISDNWPDHQFTLSAISGFRSHIVWSEIFHVMPRRVYEPSRYSYRYRKKNEWCDCASNYSEKCGSFYAQGLKAYFVCIFMNFGYFDFADTTIFRVTWTHGAHIYVCKFENSVRRIQKYSE